jgi:acid phosphatase type 7
MNTIFHLLKKNTIIFFLFLYIPLLAGEGPLPVYLTWQNDPSTTMTIQWLSSPEVTDAQVEYLKSAEKEPQWTSAQGTCKPLPLEAPYNINVLELQKLEPNCEYRFKLKNSENEYRFQTAPSVLSESFRFAVGGDVYPDGIEPFEAMAKQVALHNPKFVLLGGDLAYSASKHKDDFNRWFTFLSVLSKELKTKSGCLIPLLVAIGNHEVMGHYEQNSSKAPFFYSLFAMPGLQGYNILRFNDYLSIAILDSDHTNPITGKQTEWLSEELQKQANILHRFAIYHVAAFPSVRYFRQSISSSIRRNWVPLFEKYGIHAVFENHDHAYKRTFPLIGESHISSGVVYFGDGSWGVKPRIPKKASWTTYLAKTESCRQFLRVDISKTKREFSAITETGTIIDQYEQLAK